MKTRNIIYTLTSVTCLLSFTATAGAQNQALKDSVEFHYSDEFLDTVKVDRKLPINDYSMIGFQYGYTLSQTYFNPSKKQGMLKNPLNFGVTYTRYGKLFGYMPYFGFQTGFFYGQSGYVFKKDKETGMYTESVDGASSTTYTYAEIPLLAHFHIDVWRMKLMVNAGLYGSWRLSVEREGENVPAEYLQKFYDYERRFGYGVKGGAGIGFVLDPVEFHLQASCRYSLASLYKPDYNSEYYYRFAHPLDIIISAGVHFQLTRRTGKTKSQLKKIAKEYIYKPVVYEPVVYEPVENADGKSRQD